MQFDLPNDGYYYEISFDVFNTDGYGDTAGGYLMNYDDSKDSIGKHDEWIGTGVMSPPNFPWETNRSNKGGWTTNPITVNKKGGTVTLMAVRRSIGYAEPKLYVAFRT